MGKESGYMYSKKSEDTHFGTKSCRSSLAQLKPIEENFEALEDLEVKERDKTEWDKMNCSK